METVVTTGARRRAKLQSNRHHQQTNTQVFTGRMLFLLPNQQCRSTEEKKKVSITTHEYPDRGSLLRLLSECVSLSKPPVSLHIHHTWKKIQLQQQQFADRHLRGFCCFRFHGYCYGSDIQRRLSARRGSATVSLGDDRPGSSVWDVAWGLHEGYQGERWRLLRPGTHVCLQTVQSRVPLLGYAGENRALHSRYRYGIRLISEHWDGFFFGLFSGSVCHFSALTLSVGQ